MRRLLHLFATTLFLCIWSEASAQVCDDYSSYATGAKTWGWNPDIQSAPARVVWVRYEYKYGTGGGLTIEANAPPNNDNALKLEGNDYVVHRLDLYHEDGPDDFPTSVSLLLSTTAGDVDVDAYDDSNNLIDSTTVSDGNCETVEFYDSNGIAYLLIKGGDDEDYIDDICLDID